MVSIIKMRPWYMPMVSPFGDDEYIDRQNPVGMNVYEKDGIVYVEAPVPGVPADKVDVTFTDGQIHIHAKLEEKDSEKDQSKVVYKMERSASFEYATTIPTPIDEKSIEAEIRDGVVYVTAKVAEAAKPKKIAVRSSK